MQNKELKHLTYFDQAYNFLVKFPFKVPVMAPVIAREALYYNASNFFHQKLEGFQYNASLAITGAIRGTLKRNFTRNWALNLNQFNQGDSIENFAVF